MMVTNVGAASGIKHRHAEMLQAPLYMSFLIGVSIGLLDQLGEVPETPPPCLP